MRFPPLLSVGHVKLDIIRREPEIYERGRPVPGATTYVQVVCNVQPVLKASDTLLLPEADRSKACLKVYTKGTPMYGREEGEQGTAADRFYWKGNLYEVMKVIDYDMGILNHYKAICMRVEKT